MTPEGFHVELFADENDIHGIEDQGRPEAYLAGKPIAMNWDEKGRLWVCETVDYPNELSESGSGYDRIRVLEDTDGDNRLIGHRCLPKLEHSLRSPFTVVD